MSQYPQLDIRRYDPHLSPELADIVRGTFNFMGLPHEIRVHRLYALIELYQTVLKLGMLEHTGDWDWRITVRHGPDLAIGVTSGTTEGGWCDSMSLPYEVRPIDYLTGFERWENLAIEVWPDDADEPDAFTIFINDIRTITIGEA